MKVKPTILETDVGLFFEMKFYGKAKSFLSEVLSKLTARTKRKGSFETYPMYVSFAPDKYALPNARKFLLAPKIKSQVLLRE